MRSARAGRRRLKAEAAQRVLALRAAQEIEKGLAEEALENGLPVYEKRHPEARGLIQGSVVVLRNADAAILAEAGGRQLGNGRTAQRVAVFFPPAHSTEEL